MGSARQGEGIPKVRRDWLMLPASRARSFLAPERPMHSDLEGTEVRNSECWKHRGCDVFAGCVSQCAHGEHAGMASQTYSHNTDTTEQEGLPSEIDEI